MQMQTYFFDDPKSPDWEPTTSFRVIDDIRTSNQGFFEAIADSGHPGLKAAKLSRTGDAKMTAADISAWDDLVFRELLPSVDREIEALEKEGKRLGVLDDPHYKHAIALQRERKQWIRRVHVAFMGPYRQHLA